MTDADLAKSLERANAELGEKVRLLEEENRKLSARTAILERSNEALQEEVAEVGTENGELQIKAARLERTITEKEAEISRLKGERDRGWDTIKERDVEVKVWKEALDRVVAGGSRK